MDKNTITLLLLKEKYNESNSFKDIDSKEYSEKTLSEYLKDKNISTFQIEEKKLYYRKSQSSYPKWDSFFKKALSNDSSDKDQFKVGGLLSALYFVDISVPEEESKVRTFAITFGAGRYFLNSKCIETKFGLFTTLNAIDPKAIKSAGINTIDAVPLVSKTQATKSIGLNGIGFDTDTDVLKSIRGMISGEDIELFGKNLQGADSLQITTKATFDNIQEKLIEIYHKYKSEDYKEKFKGFMNIFFIDNPELKKKLDDELFRLLQIQDLTVMENTWLDIPEIIDSDILYFGTSKGGDEYDSLDLENIFNELKTLSLPIDKDTFLKKQIFGFNDHGKWKKQWTLYQCLISEIDYESKKYALNDGDWYEINTDFLKRVNEFYSELKVSNNIEFIDNTDSLLEKFYIEYPEESKKKRERKEAAYNYYLQKEDNDNRLLCDARNITVSGHSAIEFCDVYTKSNQLIHIKRYKGQSAPLSHLFAQGLVSARLLKNDGEFRNKVNTKLLKGTGFSPLNLTRIDPTTFEIVFGIIQATNDANSDKKVLRPQIPFFSKINLMKTVEALRAMQYEVSIALIPDKTSDKPVKTEEEKKKELKKTKGKTTSNIDNDK